MIGYIAKNKDKPPNASANLRKEVETGSSFSGGKVRLSTLRDGFKKSLGWQRAPCLVGIPNVSKLIGLKIKVNLS